MGLQQRADRKPKHVDQIEKYPKGAKNGRRAQGVSFRSSHADVHMQARRHGSRRTWGNGWGTSAAVAAAEHVNAATLLGIDETAC